MTLTVAVLTGQRPDLLTRTLDTFMEHHADLWKQATRTVFHNTGDARTAQVLDRYVWYDRKVHDGPLLPIGEASQHLAGQVAAADTEFVLRLEDDWEAAPAAWWDLAVNLLDQVGQVRLRDSSEKVSRKCMVCRKPIVWEQHDGYRITGDAHYTHNPSLMRTDQFLGLFPYDTEKQAAKRFHGQPVAQLEPGVFTHLGEDGKSLKRTVRGAR